MNECYWIEDNTPNDSIIWQTTCANAFEFSADGPKENSFKFCPYCGGKLKSTADKATTT